MSIPFSRRLGAALFLLPFHGALAADAPARAPITPRAATAVTAAATEIQAVMEEGPHLGRNLARLSSFRHTPQTAAALRDAFGKEQPWRLEQRGARNFRFELEALRHTLDNGAVVAWSAFPIDMEVDKTGQRLNYGGLWPQASLEHAGVNMAMHGLALDAKQRRGKGGLWFGDIGVKVERLSMQGGPAAPQQAQVRMNALRFAGRTLERRRTVDIVQRLDIASFEVADERIDNLTMAYRFENLDKAALVKLAAVAKQHQARGADARQALGELAGTMRRFMRAAASHKSGIVVERISASYRGHTAVLHGRVGLNGVEEADLRTPMLMLKRIDARFEVALPVALVRAVGLSVAKRQAAARGQVNATEQELQAVAQSISDVIVGKLLGGGYARLEDDVLRATIEIRNGSVRLNGKPIDLPKPKQPTPGPVPGVPTPPGQGVSMPPRRIDGSCTLPDYPETVVARDAPLALTLRVMVDANGQPGMIKVVAPSDFPDYDRAVQAAVATCRYVPALKDNALVPQGVTLSLVREPGSKRPFD